MRRVQLRGCCDVGQGGTFVTKSLDRFNALTDRWEKEKTGFMLVEESEHRAVVGLSRGERASKHSSTRGVQCVSSSSQRHGTSSTMSSPTATQQTPLCLAHPPAEPVILRPARLAQCL